MRTVEEIYRPGVVGVSADESLAAAADRMQDNDVSAVAVYQDGAVVGILTERDLVRAVLAGADVATATAEEYMTGSPGTIPLHADAREAARLMLELGVRHLLVRCGTEVVGMVSARDFLEVEARPAG